MSYLALLKIAWKSGDFRISDSALAAKGRPDGGQDGGLPPAAAREQVSREMKEIARRESWDANACLTAHREGIMKLAPFVKFREEKFGAVLFETRSEKVYTLSPTGAAVVRELVAGHDASGAVAQLKEKFDDKTGALENEARAFIAQLKDKGLVTE